MIAGVFSQSLYDSVQKLAKCNCIETNKPFQFQTKSPAQVLRRGMELSIDHEFLAAALTAITGDFFLTTIVPGPNIKIPLPYSADYLWSSRWRDPEPTVEPCKLVNSEFVQGPVLTFPGSDSRVPSFSERIQTWYCPKSPPKPKKMKENPLN